MNTSQRMTVISLLHKWIFSEILKTYSNYLIILELPITKFTYYVYAKKRLKIKNSFFFISIHILYIIFFIFKQKCCKSKKMKTFRFESFHKERQLGSKSAIWVHSNFKTFIKWVTYIVSRSISSILKFVIIKVIAYLEYKIRSSSKFVLKSC